MNPFYVQMQFAGLPPCMQIEWPVKLNGWYGL
jgi:hypothetical protein